MWLRIFLAGIVGGILMFVMGAVSHMVFQLQDRTMLSLPDKAAFMEQVKSHKLRPGIYSFPDVPANAEEQDFAMAYNELNERYKAGPAGWLIIRPTGEDMMGPTQLIAELVSNTIAALLASWIVSLFAVEVGYDRRVAALIVMGVIGWASLSVSHAIWYRFPHAFTHDELFCSLLEWSVAGAAIAAIIRRPAGSLPAAPAKPAAE